MRGFIFTVAALAVLGAGGCKKEAQPPAAARPAAARRPAATPGADTPKNPAASPVGSTAVARIVFLDKENACKCDRDRIDASWKALSEALGKAASPGVERIHFDTQPLLAATYTSMRALMVPPGIYFLDRNDKLLKMLQGEIKAAQIRQALK